MCVFIYIYIFIYLFKFIYLFLFLRLFICPHGNHKKAHLPTFGPSFLRFPCCSSPGASVPWLPGSAPRGTSTTRAASGAVEPRRGRSSRRTAPAARCRRWHRGKRKKRKKRRTRGRRRRLSGRLLGRWVENDVLWFLLQFWSTRPFAQLDGTLDLR